MGVRDKEEVKGNTIRTQYVIMMVSLVGGEHGSDVPWKVLE